MTAYANYLKKIFSDHFIPLQILENNNIFWRAVLYRGVVPRLGYCDMGIIYVAVGRVMNFGDIQDKIMVV